MSSYTFNIEQSFINGGIEQDKLYRELRTGLYKPSNIILTADDVIITFTQTLTSGEETTLNNIIANHSPIPENTGKNVQIFSVKTGPFSNTIYQSISLFNFPGNSINDLTHIKTVSYINMPSNYSIRIYDITNNRVIVEKVLNNTYETLNDLGTLSNIPYIDMLLDVQIKVEDASSRAYPKSIIIYYN